MVETPVEQGRVWEEKNESTYNCKDRFAICYRQVTIYFIYVEAISVWV